MDTDSIGLVFLIAAVVVVLGLIATFAVVSVSAKSTSWEAALIRPASGTFRCPVS